MNEPLASSGRDPAVPDAPASSKEAELVKRLQDRRAGPSLPQQLPRRAVWEKYEKSLEGVLIELVNESKTDEARNLWTRQLVDTIAAAVQSGADPSGLARLKKLESDIAKADPKSSLAATARFRVDVRRVQCVDAGGREG